MHTAEIIADTESILKKVFGYSSFRGPQKEIIEHILRGNHCMVMMPTGMGKSLCYQIPALALDGLTLVISPLISLMKDQVDALTAKGIDAAFINSSLGKDEREKRYNGIRSGKYKILYVSPERFRNRDFTDAVRCRKISLLALDEAHCVSKWGNDFRPDYAKIGAFRSLLNNPVTIALTATATADVRDDIINIAGIRPEEVHHFDEGISRPNLSLSSEEFFSATDKFERIHEHIKSRKGPAIVYFSLISSIDKFAEFLDLKKEKYTIYHGQLPPDRRRLTQKGFLHSKNALMLATNAFGMGIDKPDIRMIIHAEIPDSVESYYQEIGRAGRDGNPSDCILMYSQDDLAVQIGFLEWGNPDAHFIRNTHRLLQSLGSRVNSYSYEELQEQLVHKNRGDHRLRTVLNLFDTWGITSGSIDSLNLQLISDLPEEACSETDIKNKMLRDRDRLIAMMNYAKTDQCRREYISRYFDAKTDICGNCDNCR